MQAFVSLGLIVGNLACKYLVANGADANAMNNEGLAPHNRKAKELLRSLGAKE
jgi:hypothetical protein